MTTHIPEGLSGKALKKLLKRKSKDTVKQVDKTTIVITTIGKVGKGTTFKPKLHGDMLSEIEGKIDELSDGLYNAERRHYDVFVSDSITTPDIEIEFTHLHSTSWIEDETPCVVKVKDGNGTIYAALV